MADMRTWPFFAAGAAMASLAATAGVPWWAAIPAGYAAALALAWGSDRRQVSQPAPPRDVRVVFASGRVVPVELVYQGRHAGIHSWAAVTPVALADGERAEVRCDVLPAHTAITIGVRQP